MPNRYTFKIHILIDNGMFIFMNAPSVFTEALNDTYRQAMTLSLQANSSPEDVSFVLFYPLRMDGQVFYLSTFMTLCSHTKDAFEYICMENCSPFRSPESMLICIDSFNRTAEMHTKNGVNILKYDDVTHSEALVIAMSAYGAHESEMAEAIGCTVANIKYIKKCLCKKFSVRSMQQLLLVNFFLKLSPKTT